MQCLRCGHDIDGRRHKDITVDRDRRITIIDRRKSTDRGGYIYWTRSGDSIFLCRACAERKLLIPSREEYKANISNVSFCTTL